MVFGGIIFHNELQEIW